MGEDGKENRSVVLPKKSNVNENSFETQIKHLKGRLPFDVTFEGQCWGPLSADKLDAVNATALSKAEGV